MAKSTLPDSSAKDTALVTVDVVIDPNVFSIRPSSYQLLIAAGLPTVFLLLGASFYIVGGAFRHPGLSIALAIGAACFLALVGAYVVAYVRNTRLFSFSSTFGRRDWRGRVKAWPKSELAELRFQRVDWGGSVPRLMYLFIGRDRHLLFRLEPNFWKEADVRRFAEGVGVKVLEAPPATSKAFQKEFPEAMPPWMAHTRMRTVIWVAFFLVTVLILPVLLAIVLPRLP